MAFQSAPFAILVAHLIFDGTKVFAASEKVVQQCQDGAAIVRVSAFSENRANVFGSLITQDHRNFGTDKAIALVGIDDENKVGEAVHQAARKFLFLVETLFDRALGGDIDERSLVTNNFAGAIADGRGGIQANQRLTVLAAPSNLAALRGRLAIDFTNGVVAHQLIHENFGDPLGEEFFLGFITKHSNESWIDFQDAVFRRGDVDAFL